MSRGKVYLIAAIVLLCLTLIPAPQYAYVIGTILGTIMIIIEIVHWTQRLRNDKE